MIDVLKYVVLPKKATEVELRHVRRINRVALRVCAAHLPLFAFVAAVSHTSMAQALGFGSFLVAGPLVANYALDNPRTLSLVYGFTAMALGALLVHLGQGPVQIEMHFHFFAALALLAVWGNPLIIWVAAITVAIHHGLFWLLLPSSVFNYAAPFWVVLIHAAFVVVESIAAAFIARNFFDNVIGLDAIVQAKTKELSQRNDEMKSMLDNIGQGYMSVTREGMLLPEHSAILETWFGPWPGKQPFWRHLGSKNPDVARWLEVLWDNVKTGALPLPIALDQLPERFEVGETTYDLRFRAITQDPQNVRIVIVVSDITALVAQESAKLEQRELISMFQWIRKDLAGLNEFFENADALIKEIATDKAHVASNVHTLRGNCSVFGLVKITKICGEIEELLADSPEAIDDIHYESLNAAWQAVLNKRRQLLGIEMRGVIEVDKDEHQSLMAAINRHEPYEKLGEWVQVWSHAPVKNRLARFGEQAKDLAHRLDKGDINVVIEPNNVRLPDHTLQEFWPTFVHVIRNAIDHGLETPAERKVAGKAAVGRVQLRTLIRGDQFLLEIEDDGRGIDWKALASKARAMGLSAETQDDLVNAIFSDGVTTRNAITEISGRGLGMGAVRVACKRTGGNVKISSEPGAGTRVQFTWPVEALSR